MPPIYVNTDNPIGKKIFDASAAGSLADKAEAKMKSIVEKRVAKNAAFTIAKTDNPKGYTIRLKVASVTRDAGKTKVKITGEIVRYPPEVNKDGKEGEVMVSLGMQGNATADGTDDAALRDAIEAVAEDLADKSFKPMQDDWKNR